MPTTTTDIPLFYFLGIDQDRKKSGLEAAKFELTWPDPKRPIELLWMSKQDIQTNLGEFGPQKHLHRALADYK